MAYRSSEDSNPSKAVIADGAGNLPILRITTRAHIDAHGGKLTYEDHNYAERAGWKEIVIDRGGNGVTLRQASQTNHDVSKGLTQYPADPTLAPPQDLRAELVWSVAACCSGAGRRSLLPQNLLRSFSKSPSRKWRRRHPRPPRSRRKTRPRALSRGVIISPASCTERQLTPWMIFARSRRGFCFGVGARVHARPWENYCRGLFGWFARHVETRRFSGSNGDVHAYLRGVRAGLGHAVSV